MWRAKSAGTVETISCRSRVSDLAKLNAMLVACCKQDLGRRIDGRPVTVGRAVGGGAAVAPGAAGGAVRRGETAVPRVDAKSLVTIRQNRYSVPVALAGLRVSATIGATEIRIKHRDREVARHERLHGKYGTRALLDHYLELLVRKPGGLERSVALTQERDRGRGLSASRVVGGLSSAKEALRPTGRWSTC